jgi:integrase
MGLYQRKDSPYWWYSGTDTTGRRRRAPTKCADRRDAERVGKRLQRRWLLEDPGLPPLRLAEVLEGVRRAMVRKGNAPATLEQLAQKGGQLLRVWGPRCDVHRLDLSDLEEYVERRTGEGVKRHTAMMELRVLRHGLRLARRTGDYQRDPQEVWPGETLRGAYTPRTRWLSPLEYRRLLLRVPMHRRDHVIAYCHLGVSYSELYRIEAHDLDYEGRTVRVRGTKTRHRDRTIPLDVDAWEVLTRRATAHPTGPLFPDAWSRQRLAQGLKKWSVQAQLPKVHSTNDLRRTFCSWLANAGVPEGIAARLMGHGGTSMVRAVYAHFGGETLASAVARLPTQRDHYVTVVGADGAGSAANAEEGA